AAQRLTDYDRGLTVNVGLVRGGTSKNTVPEHAEAGVDLRFEDPGDGARRVEALRAATAQAEADVAGTRILVEGGTNRPPLARTDASAALYAEYAAIQRACGLGAAESAIVGGGSDANTVSAVGVPAIDALGPRGKGFHTTSEWVELA